MAFLLCINYVQCNANVTSSINKIEQLENKLFELYTLAELAYNKHFEKIVEDKENLYPLGWYERNNYKLKIEIITEAIKNNILIEDTQKYQELIKCVKNVYFKGQKNQFY